MSKIKTNMIVVAPLTCGLAGAQSLVSERSISLNAALELAIKALAG